MNRQVYHAAELKKKKKTQKNREHIGMEYIDNTLWLIEYL